MLLRKCAAISAVATAGLFAHFSWIGPVVTTLEVGETAKIRLGNGHTFPESEGFLKTEGLKVFAVSPSGARMDLKVTPAKNEVLTEAPIKEAGLYRFAYVHDRGILSQTAKGYLPGGRDVHPDAKKSFKSFRTSVAYAWTAGSKYSAPKPLGLTFEMTADKKGDAVTLTVLRDGKPFSGADLSVVWPGQEQKEIGKTDATGKFVYTAPAGAKGPVLFTAASVEPAQKGANYDTINYGAGLFLPW